MTDPNMPSDMRGAETYHLAKKAQLIELAEKIATGEIETFSQFNGYIWSEIKRIDEVLEG